MTGMTLAYFMIVFAGFWSAMVYQAVLDGPPAGERLRVWLPALCLTLLIVALASWGLWLALGPARFDTLLVTSLSLMSHSWHHGPANGVDRVYGFGWSVMLVFPALLRLGVRRARRRSDAAIAAAIARWGRGTASAREP